MSVGGRAGLLIKKSPLQSPGKINTLVTREEDTSFAKTNRPLMARMAMEKWWSHLQLEV